MKPELNEKASKPPASLLAELKGEKRRAEGEGKGGRKPRQTMEERPEDDVKVQGREEGDGRERERERERVRQGR